VSIQGCQSRLHRPAQVAQDHDAAGRRLGPQIPALLGQCLHERVERIDEFSDTLVLELLGHEIPIEPDAVESFEFDARVIDTFLDGVRPSLPAVAKRCDGLLTAAARRLTSFKVPSVSWARL
jgi:hypothetical protein